MGTRNSVAPNVSGPLSSHSTLCTMFTMQHFFSVVPHETAVPPERTKK